MSWSTPTVDSILSEFTPSENSTISRLMGGGGLDDTTKLAVILARVVEEIIGYIKAGGYEVDEDETKIPSSLFNDAIAIARWRFLIAVPQFKQFQTDERGDANKESIAKLRLVAAGKFFIEPPASETPVTPPSGRWDSEAKLVMRTHLADANP